MVAWPTSESPLANREPLASSMVPGPLMELAMVWEPVTLKIRAPSSSTEAPTSPLETPSPSCRVVPLSMVVRPVKVLIPVRVSVPPWRCRAPEPAMTPPKVPDAAARVRVLLPSDTWPDPDRV